MTSEHPVAYDAAADLPFTDVLNRWQALEQRDAMARAITTLQARGDWHDDRSLDPADWPPLTVAEHLELLALGEVAARRFRHPAAVHQAVLAGATWEQIADATGSDAEQARHAYLAWAEEQHDLRQQYPGGTIGLDDAEYTAAIEAAGPVARHPLNAELNARRTAAAAVLTDYKAAVASAPLTSPPGREWMLRLASVLEGVLAVPEGSGAAAEDTRRLEAIRAVLAGFDWERGDRQYALEEIDRIASGAQQ
jgi:hypothetical protein